LAIGCTVAVSVMSLPLILWDGELGPLGRR
jgi:hypothetical protein